MISQSDWIFLLFVLLMESFNWRVSIYEYFNWPTVYLRYCLQLNIITPHSIDPFVVDVFFEVSLNIVLEEALLTKDIIHTERPNLSMMLLCS